MILIVSIGQKEEFENEWEDQDYYERDNSQQNAREIGQTNETVVPVEKGILYI